MADEHIYSKSEDMQETSMITIPMDEDSDDENENMQGETTNNTIIYISDGVDKADWKKKDTRALLKLCDEKMDLVELGVLKSQKKMWETISRDMIKQNFFHTPAQCENKWKSLKRAFKNKMLRIQMRKTITPRGAKFLPFEREICDILNKREGRAGIMPQNMSFKVEDEDKFIEFNLNEPPGPSNQDGCGDSSDDDTTQQRLNYEDIFINEGTGEIHQNGTFNIQTSNNQKTTKKDPLEVIAKELRLLREEFKSHNENVVTLTKECLKIQDGITENLYALKRTKQESNNIETKRIKQQEEVVNQMKLQNRLIQKVLEKLYG